MSQVQRRDGGAGAWGWGLAALLYAAGLWTMFGHTLVAHTSLGDTGDGTIALSEFEHWYRVFTRQAADWMEPGWYWPAPRTLGYMDSQFLLSLPYSLARALGADWFLANDVVVWTLATLGFWGMVALTRRLGVPSAIGAVAAYVFSFGVVAEFKLFHLQLYTLQLAPTLGLMLVAAWHAGRWSRAAWSMSAGLLVGLMFFSAAQAPWFLGLETGLAILAGLGFAWWHRGWRDGVLRGLAWGRIYTVGAWFGVGLVIGMVPFFALYWQSVGLVRTYDDIRSFKPWLRDPLNIPPGEWLWFDLLQRLGITGRNGREPFELALGLTPMFALLGVSCLIGARRLSAARGMAAAGLIGPLLTIEFWGIDPWRLVYGYVPGGSAVRTPFRIEMAAQFYLLIGVSLAAAALVRTATWRRAALARYAVYAAGAVLVAEQIGDFPADRDTRAMQRWLDAAHRPAFACEAFYLVPKPGAVWQDYQSDAMLLSQKLGMPTLNGNSSFYPPGWGLQFPDRSTYAGQVRAWIDAHGLQGRVCGADPRAGVWVPGIEALEAR